MESNQLNKQSWNTGAYQAWMNRFGPPCEAVKKIKENPGKRIGKALQYMGDIKGKRIVNLLGSNGNKAVALALMGAEVTIVDFSVENKAYADELAAAAGVRVEYVVADVMQLPEEQVPNSYDVVFMEFGILHYFLDLKPLFEIVSKLLQPQGVLILQDFHPVSTKLICSRGTTANIRKHKVTGNYFDTALQEKEVAFSKFLQAAQQPVQKVQLRNWTMGEIITAVAHNSLYIRTLEELPNESSETFDVGIPKTFTIVAEKI